MQEYIKIVNIIDKSGSMYNMIDTAIDGFNSFLNEQKTVDGDAVVTTVTFSNLYNKMYDSVDVQDCALLSAANYRPGGTTALYDAIGKTISHEIDLLGNLPNEERPTKTLCVILTDGQENSSVVYKKGAIKEMIGDMKENFKWEFIFLAADENASLTAETIGISKGNSFAFSNSSDGLKDAYDSVSFATSSYRSMKSTKVDNLMDDYRDTKK